MSRSQTQKMILVTRAMEQSSRFVDLLTQVGFAVVEMPALEIRPPSTWAPLDAEIARLVHFDWLVLTSANAVNYFLARVAHWQATADLAHLKLAVVGQKTAAVLKQHGWSPDYVPPDYLADALVAHFPVPVEGLKLLFPRVESGGRDVLVQAMTAAGAAVTEVPAYESGCPQQADPAAIAALRQSRVQAITFSSSKTVRHGCHLLEKGLGATWREYLVGVAIASIGPQTSATCHELLGRVDIEASEYTLEGLTQAITQWFNASSD
jgi:uroporphyrinogen-III synthase